MSRIIGSYFAGLNADTDNIDTMPKAHLEKELLEAALVGFRQHQSIIEAKITEIGKSSATRPTAV